METVHWCVCSLETCLWGLKRPGWAARRPLFVKFLQSPSARPTAPLCAELKHLPSQGETKKKERANFPTSLSCALSSPFVACRTPCLCCGRLHVWPQIINEGVWVMGGGWFARSGYLVELASHASRLNTKWILTYPLFWLFLCFTAPLMLGYVTLILKLNAVNVLSVPDLLFLYVRGDNVADRGSCKVWGLL